MMNEAMTSNVVTINGEVITRGQVESWYHSKIPRIPHGKQNPAKRYLTNKQIIELFSGRFLDIYEKVDGRLTSEMVRDYDGENNDDEVVRFFMVEDMTGKNTVHRHVMKYLNLPKDKRIIFDAVVINKRGEKIFDCCDVHGLQYCRVELHMEAMAIKYIYKLLETWSRMSSHFGSDRIEGLVIKNIDKQLMGKWINDEFEDGIKESKK